MTELIPIILASGVVSAIVTAVINYFINQKNTKIKYITEERKIWREKIREIAVKLQQSQEKELPPILAELKVRINAYGRENPLDFKNDGHIWFMLKRLENRQGNFEINKRVLVEMLSYLLKHDWERSKTEVKGNMLLAGMLLFLIAAVSIICCNFYSDVVELFLILSSAAVTWAIYFGIIYCKWNGYSIRKWVQDLVNPDQKSEKRKRMSGVIPKLFFAVCAAFVGIYIIYHMKNPQVMFVVTLLFVAADGCLLALLQRSRQKQTNYAKQIARLLRDHDLLHLLEQHVELLD